MSAVSLDTTRKHAFRMFIKPGCMQAYKQRHDEIWPELVQLLKGVGIEDYSIYLDEPRGVLFAVLRQRIELQQQATDLPNHPVMRRWWSHMADLMETQADGAPVSEPMPCLFHLV